MWTLAQNNLKILIDPFLFADRSVETISKQVNLVNTFQDYLKNTEPAFCKVTFFFPRYAEESFGLRRTFFEDDGVTFIDEVPVDIIEVLKEPVGEGLEALQSLIKTYNSCITVAIKNKCAFIITNYDFHKDIKIDLLEKYGLEIIKLEDSHKKIEQFLQGFFNYFKFRVPIYGLRAPDIAHAMTEEFFQTVLIPFETSIHKSKPSNELRERIRSFVHNRYVDILVTIDQVNFFKIQQRISDIENGTLDNKKPHLHGHIRYYLNYYLFLLWGATDHLAWIMNDLFGFGYDSENYNHLKNVGLNNTKGKQDFLLKIKAVNQELYDYIVSDSFQEWLNFFGQLRHQNAHREMFSASPLIIETDESKISDEEIDNIIYKDHPPLEEEAKSIKMVMGEEVFRQMKENQKINDRLDYRILKSKKGLEHFALVKKGDKQFIFDPVARIPTDMKNLRELIEKISLSYKTFMEPLK